MTSGRGFGPKTVYGSFRGKLIKLSQTQGQTKMEGDFGSRQPLRMESSPSPRPRFAPQPLALGSRRCGGTKRCFVNSRLAPSRRREKDSRTRQTSPLPLRERGRGRGGELRIEAENYETNLNPPTPSSTPECSVHSAPASQSKSGCGSAARNCQSAGRSHLRAASPDKSAPLAGPDPP